MAQGKKKKVFYRKGRFDFCIGKGIDCVTKGERNLCTILGGLVFTALFFLGFFRATGRLSRQRGDTRGADEGRLRAQRAVGQTCNSHSWPCCCSRRGTDAFCRIMLWAKRAMKGTRLPSAANGTGARDGTRGGVNQLFSLNFSLEKRLDSNIGWRTRPCLSRNRALD